MKANKLGYDIKYSDNSGVEFGVYYDSYKDEIEIQAVKSDSNQSSVRRRKMNSIKITGIATFYPYYPQVYILFLDINFSKKNKKVSLHIKRARTAIKNCPEFKHLFKKYHGFYFPSTFNQDKDLESDKIDAVFSKKYKSIIFKNKSSSIFNYQYALKVVVYAKIIKTPSKKQKGNEKLNQVLGGEK